MCTASETEVADVTETLTRSSSLKKLEEFSDELEKREQKYVKCSDCQHVLTHAETAIAVLGSHVHTKTNPFGRSFSFRCFKEGLGCFVRGDSQEADSWFPRHVWQYLHCEACNVHLGWFFTGEDSFFGIREDQSYIE